MKSKQICQIKLGTSPLWNEFFGWKWKLNKSKQIRQISEGTPLPVTHLRCSTNTFPAPNFLQQKSFTLSLSIVKDFLYKNAIKFLQNVRMDFESIRRNVRSNIQLMGANISANRFEIDFEISPLLWRPLFEGLSQHFCESIRNRLWNFEGIWKLFYEKRFQCWSFPSNEDPFLKVRPNISAERFENRNRFWHFGEIS